MARQVASRADDMLSRLDRIVAANEGAINRTLSNVDTFSKTLADAGPAVSTLVKAIDGTKLGKVIDNADRFSAALGSASPTSRPGFATPVRSRPSSTPRPTRSTPC